MSNKVISLAEDITYQPPEHWQYYARFAVSRKQEKQVIPAGTWLYEMGEEEKDGERAYIYRLPAGQMVAFLEPVAGVEITDPNAVASMAAYKSLGDYMVQKGLALERIDALSPSPWAMIQCPLCFGTEFTTVDFAEVYCDRCGAKFKTRTTCGDPGFVVDVDWTYYNPLQAKYILPPTPELTAMLIFKSHSLFRTGPPADPTDMSTAHCECDDKPSLTNGNDGLRPGLHECYCNIYECNGWTFYGQVPTTSQVPRNWQSSSWKIGEHKWPICTCRTAPHSNLDYDQKMWLKMAAGLLAQEGHQDGEQVLHNLIEEQLSVSSMPMPSVEDLGQDEYYILLGWLKTRPKHSASYDYAMGKPLWAVVRAEFTDPDRYGCRELRKWHHLRTNICPFCGRAVSREEWEHRHDEPDTPCWHEHWYRCREQWDWNGWQPYFGKTDADTAAPASSPGSSEKTLEELAPDLCQV